MPTRNADFFAVELQLRLEESFDLKITKAASIEIRDIIREAMQHAWERGNGYDHGMPFSEEML